MSARNLNDNVLPGFKLTMSLTLAYLLILVIFPISALYTKALQMPLQDFLGLVQSPRLLAAIQLSFVSAFLAASINVVLGTLVAWVLVRYEFFGKTLIDMLVDLPMALPTAVAGIALTTAFAPNGAIGSLLSVFGIRMVYNQAGVVLALLFVTFPFVVRTVQPVLKNYDFSVEEASACLGARRWQTFAYVMLPELRPAIISGFTMAFARALGEYGSIIFISGNLPMRTEIAPLLIISKLEEYDYIGAAMIGAILLCFSFIMLALINHFSLRKEKVVAAIGGES